MHFKTILVCFGVLATTLVVSGCSATPPNANEDGSTALEVESDDSDSSSSTDIAASQIQAFEIITKASSTGSFNLAAVPAAGGLTVTANRLFEIDGSQIPTANVPTWFSEAAVFLTSTRTSAGAATNTDGDTNCAYFDTTGTDNNPDSSGFYTIDGFNPTTVATSDIDQCAGTDAAELNKLQAYVTVDRRFLNSTDKLQFIIKAKVIEAPNSSPNTSSCVVGANFDASACSNQLFTLSMRSAPQAAAKPFYILFPSAKALDLLSETIFLPIHIDGSLDTITIDRVKGGAILYGITVVRLQ